LAQIWPGLSEVDTAGVRVENSRQFGGPWLAMQMIDQLGLDDFLSKNLPPGREQVPWSLTAVILVIARLLNPSSELHIAEQWYNKEDRVLAHILVCFLAYVLWKTLGQLCQSAGLGNEPRRVLTELSDIRLVNVVLPTRTGIDIRRRCVSRPSDHQRILLEKLQLRLPSRIIQNQM
jgi:hypothetical protein